MRGSRAVASDLVAGVVPGLLISLHCVSVGAILTAGPLAPHRTLATTLVLLGCAVLALVVAARSSLRYVMVFPSYFAAAILFPALRDLGTSLERDGQAAAVGPTLWAFVGLSTVLGGLFMYALGRSGRTTLVRYIPYPIVAGILASAGWLMCEAGVAVLLVGEQSAQELFRDDWIYVAPAVALAGLILLTQRFVRTAAALPALLFLFIAGAHVLRHVLGVSLAEAQDAGWFVRPFDVDVRTVGVAFLSPEIAWGPLAAHLTTILIVVAIMPTIVALQISAAEVVVGEEADLDREFRASGAANIVAGGAGAVFSTIASGMTAFAAKLGAQGRAATVVAGATVASVVFFCAEAVSALPTAVVAGLSLALGAHLLLEWVILSRRRLTRSEHLLIVLIVGVVVVFGFVQGITLGLIAASALFTIRYSQMDVIKHAVSGESFRSNVERPPQQKETLARYGGQLYILELQGYLFFGTAYRVYAEVLRRRERTATRDLDLLLLDLRRVTGVDSSAAAVFVKIRRLFEGSGGAVVWTGVSAAARRVLEQAKALEAESHVFSDLDHGAEWCEERILKEWVLESERAFQLDDQLRRFLSEEQIPVFREHLRRRDVAAGTHLARQGDSSDSMFFLDLGQLSVLAELPDGRRRRLRTFVSGTILGEQAFYTQQPRSASILADEDSVVFELSREAFAKLMKDAPVIANALHERLVTLLAVRLDQTRAELESLLR